jgi:hypothetical protein
MLKLPSLFHTGELKMKQFSLLNQPIEDKNPNDDVFTPDNIAKLIVDYFKPVGKILEPCKGKGAFLKALPKGTDWCEITEGKDFFEYKKHVDWIVTNPPYSTFNKFLDHSFEVADNVLFLAPIYKLFKSWEVMMKIKAYGGVVNILMLPAHKCGFNFGFPCGAFHFQKGYLGSTLIRYGDYENGIVSIPKVERK